MFVFPVVPVTAAKFLLCSVCHSGKAEEQSCFALKEEKKKTTGHSNCAISTTKRIVREQISWNCTAQGYNMALRQLAAAKDNSTEQCNEAEVCSPQPLKS